MLFTVFRRRRVCSSRPDTGAASSHRPYASPSLTPLFHADPIIGSAPLTLALLAVVPLSFLPALSHAESRDVRIGVYQNSPKIMMGTDEMPSGILGDLIVEIARQEHWQLTPVRCEWQQCLELLQSGAIDLMPDVAFSDQRAAIFDFHHTPSLYSWSQVYQNSEENIQSIIDLHDKRIAVMDGSIQQSYLDGLLKSFSVNAQLVPVRNLEEAFELVAGHKADVAVSNAKFGDFQAPNYHLEATPIMFQPAKLFYATPKGKNADLLQAIDHYLDLWEADSKSVYYDILQRWGGKAPKSLVPEQIWWWLYGLIALLVLATGGNALLRRQVRQKTRYLQASEDKLATILNTIDSYIYIKDTQLNYQYANKKVCDLFDTRLEELLGKSDEAFFDEQTCLNLHQNDRKVLSEGKRLVAEEVNRSNDGRLRTYHSIKMPLRHENGSIYAICGISTDITDQKQHLQEIHRLAFYDTLTQLPNRRLLIERLQTALSSREAAPRSGALLFIDLDNFKDLNDTMGHDVGDQLLQQVTQRLQAEISTQDTIARLGGDEFVMMLDQLDTDSGRARSYAESLGRRLLAVLSRPYQLSGHICNTTASIGITLFDDPKSTVEELLKHADLAMYQAKAAGRNTLRFFTPDLQSAALARAAVEADMRVALVSRQFLLHYQPQVDLDGKLQGAEALIRWQHPAKGLIPPAQFIPVAEATGLILPLGQWILRQACRQLVEWSQHPYLCNIPVAVNVSVRQFHHPDFASDVLEILGETGAAPHLLKLEITESQLISNMESTIYTMNRLRRKGVHFSLDDFGTGYSSLSYLKRLPLDQLKIDRSFVRDLLSDANDAAIIKTIIALGQTLDMHIIAEGVETLEQRDKLIELGCHLFQGYLFGQPGPAEALHREYLTRAEVPFTPEQ
ncbi:diguanylate cyclase [Pokkaliibacter plantistimulans]|uniref:Diguanylate cyclase n=1 Tax=Proteobacteria bacterium 228 TaxID=2083153 RepID=A0A2S5KIN6_9PROT|nr:diguanylate cyclase [Pokkaliibacter plantistimulans]